MCVILALKGNENRLCQCAWRARSKDLIRMTDVLVAINDVNR